MNYNIIVADDVLVNRILLREQLKTYKNIKLIEVNNGQECIDAVDDSIDLILMDVMMPIIDGIEATKIIKTNFPKIIIIGVTGQYENEKHLVFDKMLYKPYRSTELYEVINTYLKL